MQSNRRVRRNHFNRWWYKNHHNHRAQLWLVRNSKRVIHSLPTEPSLFEDVKYICKRFNNAEHARLTNKEAWCLWKVCHPTTSDSIEKLTQAAAQLDQQIHELKQLKAQAQGYKPAQYPPIKINIVGGDS